MNTEEIIAVLNSLYSSGLRFPELGTAFDAVIAAIPLSRNEWRQAVEAGGGDRCPICGDRIEYQDGVHCAARACPSQDLK